MEELAGRGPARDEIPIGVEAGREQRVRVERWHADVESDGAEQRTSVCVRAYEEQGPGGHRDAIRPPILRSGDGNREERREQYEHDRRANGRVHGWRPLSARGRHSAYPTSIK